MKTLSILIIAFSLFNFNSIAQSRGGSIDVGAIRIIEPAPGSLLVQGQSYPVTVRIQNFEFDFTNLPITVWFKIGDDSVSATSTYSINYQDSTTVAFATNLNFTHANSLVASAYTVMNGDNGNSNDTVHATYETIMNNINSVTPYNSLVVQQMLSGSNEIILQVISAKTETAMLTLYDITGKILKQFPAALNSGSSVLHLCADNLSAGIYFVKVRMNDGSVTVRKVVKE